MSAVEVTISGVLWDKALKAGRPVTIIGEAIITGLGVGGGPVIPPGNGGGGGGSPPGIWGGGNVPMPTPPIANVPGAPGYEPPNKPPEPIEPPIEWKTVWHPVEGWIVVGVPNFEHPAPAE